VPEPVYTDHRGEFPEQGGTLFLMLVSFPQYLYSFFENPSSDSSSQTMLSEKPL